ncbi:hypothetical protein FRC10_011841 [Ceratobasidium sp. 414]|nr:hypothetical protein FRC10_011841 [Ceratobasidium sp. 414]
MSLLRQVLRRQTGGGQDAPKKPGYAGSIKSMASVKTVAASIASFYTAVTVGGTRVPKRRRAPKSELGRPMFVSKDPPLPELPVGIEASPIQKTPTSTHVKTLKNRSDEPVLSLLLHNFATAEDGYTRAVYTRNTTVSGEVRLVVTKPDPIESIDVWIGLKSGCSVVAAEPYILKLNATLWTPKDGDPRRESGAPAEPYTGVLQPGTYVFPFSFEPLPENVQIIQEEKKATAGRVSTARVEVKARHDSDPDCLVGSRTDTTSALLSLRYDCAHQTQSPTQNRHTDPVHPSSLDTRFSYHPNYRLAAPTEPLPPFPLIPTREDWPYEREVIGGWSITPFGGRGRWNLDSMVEVEGLLGIRHPCAAHPGDELDVMLLLWCQNAEALAELSKPESIELSFVRTNILGVDALSPSSRTRKNRLVWPRRHIAGRVWLEGEAPKSPTDSGYGRETESEPSTPEECQQPESERPASPVGSFEEDMFPGAADAENIVKLCGSVPVALSSGIVGPSFRYKNIAAEVRHSV